MLIMGMLLVGVGEEAVATNFHKPGRQDIQEEAADEFLEIEGAATGIFFFAVLGDEGDATRFEQRTPVVTDYSLHQEKRENALRAKFRMRQYGF